MTKTNAGQNPNLKATAGTLSQNESRSAVILTADEFLAAVRILESPRSAESEKGLKRLKTVPLPWENASDGKARTLPAKSENRTATGKNLEDGYKAMAADRVREKEARDWLAMAGETLPDETW